jgi:hypothetical protein
LELYSQIAVSGERKRAEQEARSLANASITQLQESHVKTLTALKKQWENQQAETQRLMSRTEMEKQALQRRVRQLEQELKRQNRQQQYQTETGQDAASDERSDESPPGTSTEESCRQSHNSHYYQNTYNGDKVRELFDRYSNLVSERQAIRKIINRKGQNNVDNDEEEDDEQIFLQSFEQTLFFKDDEEEKKQQPPKSTSKELQQKQNDDDERQQSQSGNGHERDDAVEEKKAERFADV